MSTHRGTSLIPLLLLHVLLVETAPLTATGRLATGDTKALAVGDARGTSFWKATMSTHHGHKFNLLAPSPRTPSRNCTPHCNWEIGQRRYEGAGCR